MSRSHPAERWCGNAKAQTDPLGHRRSSADVEIVNAKWSDFPAEQPNIDPGPYLCAGCGHWIPCRLCEEGSTMTDVVDGQSRAVSTSEFPENFIPRRDSIMALRRMERMLRILLAPTKADPYFRRGTPHYEEATRVLGASAGWTLDVSARQISKRWLKVDRFVLDADGEAQLTAANDGTLVTESVRIRIPRDSWLARGYSHRRHRKGLPAVG